MGSKEKKRSKKASQIRKKKRDRYSRKRIAKKLCRHEDSYSKSDDESLSLVSSSSYSSEEGVATGRRSRSRVRKDVKGRKKRATSSSCSNDSSSDSIRLKKRKSSKKKVGLGRKKKSGKKYKRTESLGSTGSDESEYEKSKDELRKKGALRRYDKEEKIKRKKKRSKARSISSSSESSASDNERKRKRCRSPSCSSLSMRRESEREGKRKRYWSPSDTSLSRGSKSSDQRVQDESKVQNRPIRKLKSIIVVASSAEPDQNFMSKRVDNDLDTRDYERSTKASIEEKMGVTEAITPVPDKEDLETILRRKALENLKRFRQPKTSEKSEKIEMSPTGVKQLPNSENAADQKNMGGSDMKLALSPKTGPVQIESDKDRVLNENLVSYSEKEEIFANPSVSNKNTSFNNNVEPRTGGTKSAQCSEDSRVMIPKAVSLNLPAVADINSNSGNGSVSRHNIIPQSGNFSNDKAALDPLLSSHEHLAECSTKGLKSSPQECVNATPMITKCSTDKSSNSRIDEVNHRSIHNIIKESNIVNTTVPDNPSSSIPDTVAGEHVSCENQKDNKEDSQFQEKTMTVMRGGELVQVSYKVYIPKKAPAANRRRLNR